MNCSDVLIIGAGPAGSVAAGLLRKQGHQVLILEKETFPRFSIGESLLPQSMAYIEEAGMLQAVVEAGFQPVMMKSASSSRKALLVCSSMCCKRRCSCHSCCCMAPRSRISWTQVETGSAITWKYPSCVLRGDDSVGEFYSVALTHHRQQADTGTKMIHLGRNTKSKIISKGISAGRGQNTYRGLVKMEKTAAGARNYTQCDSLLIGKKCGAHTFPYIEVKHPTATVEHEATTSKISDDQMFYCRSRGISQEDAVSMIVDGFCKQVFRELPMEFAVEAKKLLEVSLEGSVG